MIAPRQDAFKQTPCRSTAWTFGCCVTGCRFAPFAVLARPKGLAAVASGFPRWAKKATPGIDLIGKIIAGPCRVRSAASALLGRPEEARKYYDEALKVTTEMRFRPELALTRLQLAELLLEHYPDEKAAALEHLDFAIKEFREMKMQPSLERALKLVGDPIQK